MAITADDKWLLRKGCIHDEPVRIALAGFLVAHFEYIGVDIDPEIFHIALTAFAATMRDPGIVNKSAELVQAIQRAKRESMH